MGRGRPSKEIMKDAYMLFSQEKHEKIDWVFEKSDVDQIQRMWDKEYSIEYIAKTLKMDEFSVTLILMDLLYINKLKQRRSGLFRGRVA